MQVPILTSCSSKHVTDYHYNLVLRTTLLAYILSDTSYNSLPIAIFAIADLLQITSTRNLQDCL